MKILRIALCNIASLAGAHTVDFTRDPLRSAGLYSISGPTGSGKSSLLDALCLALYDNTPRLNQVGREARLKDHGGEITQRDSGNLLRRGAGSGFAEVAFVGVDGETYTARWSIRRAREKADGALQNADYVLFRGNVVNQQGSIAAGGKKGEVLAMIQQKVGLSFAQFTRAVLLAQNDFATFLKADDKERAEILQALTGTERFEALSVSVFVRNKREQELVAEIVSKIEGSAPFAPEERAAAEAVLGAAQAAFQSATDAFLATKAHVEWFDRLAVLTADEGIANAELAGAIAQRDAAKPRAAEFEQTGELLRLAAPLRTAELRAIEELKSAEAHRASCISKEVEAARSMAERSADMGLVAKAHEHAQHLALTTKPLLSAARELDAKIPPALAALESATKGKDAAMLVSNAAAAKHSSTFAKHDDEQRKLAALTKQRRELAVFAPFVGDAGAWMERLDRAADSLSKLHAARKKCEDLEARFAETRSEMVTAASLAGDVSKRVDAALELFRKEDDAARLFDAEAIATARKVAYESGKALREYAGYLREVSVRDALLVELAALKTSSEVAVLACAELETKRVPQAGVALTTARRALELAEAAVHDAAVAFRSKLAPHAPCPVCGATEHPFSSHAPSPEGESLRAIRNLCGDEEEKLGAAKTELANAQASVRSYAERIKEKAKSLAETQKRIADLGDSTAAHEVMTASALEARIAESDAAAKAADKADEQRRKAERARDKVRVECEKLAKESDVAKKRLAGLEVRFAEVKSARDASASSLADALKEHESAVGVLEALFSGSPKWKSRWEEAPAEFGAEFSEGTRELASSDVKRTELDAQIAKTAAELVLLSDSLGVARSELAARETVETSATVATETLKSQRAAYFEGRAADAIEADLESGIKTSCGRMEKAGAALGDAEKHRAVCADAMKSADLAFVDCQAKRTAAAAALDCWLAEFSQRTDRVLERVALDAVLARDEAWLAEEMRVLSALEAAVRTHSGALEVRKDLLHVHQRARPTTDDEVVVRAALSMSAERHAIAQKSRDDANAVLLSDDQRRAACAAHASALETRKLAARPWERLNELVGSSDGAKFRSIAQRRTLDVLLGYANAQLAAIAGRYRLRRIEESLNLVVIDCEMGDEVRSVHSLSGGESFLVSLSLALGLAALTSNRLRIESLFIDEGFGSLDVDTLNVAMGALMRLEAQGRKIGVISHVSEMADAIPVQIRVIKGRGGASKLLVPGAAPAVEDTVDESSEVAGKIIEILKRHAEGGESKVSSKALREELGCDVRVFVAAREALGGRVRTDGRGLSLA